LPGHPKTGLKDTSQGVARTLFRASEAPSGLILTPLVAVANGPEDSPAPADLQTAGEKVRSRRMSGKRRFYFTVFAACAVWGWRGNCNAMPCRISTYDLRPPARERLWPTRRRTPLPDSACGDLTSGLLCVDCSCRLLLNPWGGSQGLAICRNCLHRASWASPAW
jgi:hypothetical protein